MIFDFVGYRHGGPFDCRLSRNIARARQQAGYSRRDLAGMLGLSEEDIAEVERGNIRPAPRALLEIAGVLQVALRLLLFEDFNPANESGEIGR